MKGAIVTFAPGARTAWHSHPFGKTLVVSFAICATDGWAVPFLDAVASAIDHAIEVRADYEAAMRDAAAN